MSDKKAPEKSAQNLIQGIKDGSIDPSALSKEERQSCVEAMVLEGCSAAQMAQLLSCSEKTIRRDLADIRARNAINPSPELARQIIGNFVMKSEAHQARLMRLARSSEGPPGVRVEAEVAAFHVLLKSAQLLQSLGILPMRSQKIVGDFVHHLSTEENERSLDEIEKAIYEVASIGEGSQTLTPEIAEQIANLKCRLENAKLSQDAQKLLEQQQKLSNEKE